jgi:peptide/nickel transport system substrate-binding protein
MQRTRLRIVIAVLVLIVAGVGGWQLIPSDDEEKKTITVGTTEAISSLDPAGAYDAGSWAEEGNVFQTLLTFKPNSITPDPDAARSCGFVGSELVTYRCELRDDLSFSNGHKLTGEDVKYSIDRVKRIKAKTGPQSIFSTVKSVSTKGSTVTFRLNTRDAIFPLKLATGAASIVDHSEYPADRLRDGSGADGSGPYLLTSYAPGSQAHLEPNKKYKGVITKLGGPVNIHYFKSSEELAAAWKAGTVDVAHRQLPPSLTASLNTTRTDIRVNEVDSAEIRNMVFNVRKGSPMNSTATRQAIAMIVDRSKLVRDVYHLTADPLYSLIPRGITAHSAAFFDTYPEPDPDGARQLLERAGVHTPITFTLAHASGGSWAPEAAELKSQLEKTGLFKVKVIEKEWEDFTEGFGAGKFDAYTIGWLDDFADPDNFIQPLIGSDSSLQSGYSSAEAEKLIRNTQQYSDRGRTTGNFRTLQQLVAKDVPILPLWQKKDYVLSKEDVIGGQHLADVTGIWRLWELSWV